MSAVSALAIVTLASSLVYKFMGLWLVWKRRPDLANAAKCLYHASQDPSIRAALATNGKTYTALKWIDANGQNAVNMAEVGQKLYTASRATMASVKHAVYVAKIIAQENADHAAWVAERDRAPQ